MTKKFAKATLRHSTRAAIGLVLAVVPGGCASNDATQDMGGSAGRPMLVDMYAIAGRTSNVGFKGWGKTSAGSGGAGSAGDDAGQNSAGAAGLPNAGAGGGAGAPGAAGAAGTATTGAAGAAGDGATVEPDPLDAFGLGSGDPAAVSCEGLVCLEAADCQDLYPEEHAACNFTRCEDFACK